MGIFLFFLNLNPKAVIDTGMAIPPQYGHKKTGRVRKKADLDVYRNMEGYIEERDCMPNRRH